MGLFDGFFDLQQFQDSGGLPGRLLSLQRQQGLHQLGFDPPPSATDGQSSSLRQSLAPLSTLQPNLYGFEQRSPIVSDFAPGSIRSGSQYAQAPLGLCAAGPVGCAAGTGLAAAQILGGAGRCRCPHSEKQGHSRSGRQASEYTYWPKR